MSFQPPANGLPIVGGVPDTPGIVIQVSIYADGRINVHGNAKDRLHYTMLLATATKALLDQAWQEANPPSLIQGVTTPLGHG